MAAQQLNLSVPAGDYRIRPPILTRHVAATRDMQAYIVSEQPSECLIIPSLKGCVKCTNQGKLSYIMCPLELDVRWQRIYGAFQHIWRKTLT